MSLDNLYPFAGGHAIQSVAFALDFISELDISEVTAIQAAATSELGNEFPIVAPQQLNRLEFKFEAGSSGSSTASAEVNGFVMQRPSISATAPLRLISVTRKGVVIAVNDYTRWDKFKEDINKYLSALLATIDGQKAISSIGLQVNDVFLWKSDPADLKLDEVFTKNNPYIVSNAFQVSSLWHSHHGYLIKHEAPVKYQQLDNINISRTEVDGVPHLQILISQSVTFLEPLYKFWSTNKNTILEIQESLHDGNKNILKSLLTQAVQDKISLNIEKG
jgi:uncharacterized protein (TIGR04255 family)